MTTSESNNKIIRKQTTMKRSYLPAALLLTVLLCLISCTREEALGTQKEKTTFTIVGDPVEVHLSIEVGSLTFGVATRAEEPVPYDGEDSEAERHIDDLWVFEYDASSGDLVNTPVRIEITDQSILEDLNDVPVTLADNNGSPVIVYVVANSGSGVSENSANWVVFNEITESYDGFMTIDELEANVIPTPHPQRMTWDESTETYVLDTQDASAVSIPMGGYSGSVTVSDNSKITVPVSRMFAKLLVRVDLSDFNTDDYNTAWLSTITIGNIPEYCTVGTLWDGDRGDSAEKADYSSCERWIQRTFNSVGETSDDTGSTGDDEDAVYPYLIYVPENIQGENRVDDFNNKADNVPNAYALTVTAGIYIETTVGAMMGEYTSFVAYPGGNNTTNFNVRRNCLYRVTIKINDLIDDILPSANCIVCLSGETTAFFPYCREETGGGYDFEDYLYAYDDGAKAGQKIDHVGIIWQSTDGGNTVGYSSSATGYIGNNSNNEYVWIDNVENVKDEYHRRIHVSIPAGKTGNALVGAYNANNEIVWSWHIWSREAENDPRTVNTKLYYTYEWDENGIYGKDSGRARVAGYTIMNCNLGAMQDDISGRPSTISAVLRTFGTLYQWGRKDPFPPIRVYPGTTNSTTAINTYDSSQTGNYFDNENNVVTIVNTNEASALFHSVEGTDRKEFDEMVPLTIQNPTVFYAGTKDLDQKSAYYIAFMNGGVSDFYENYPEPCDGNWMLDSDSDHFNRLWGGLDPENDTDDQITKSYDTGLTDALGNSLHIYDDYGEKSIFDPCPYGWRVPPPDLWLGFTDTGLNPTDHSSMDEINYNDASDYSGQYGLTMYMTAWREGETSFFPTQGVRAPDGCSYKVGCCGNYNNATADLSDRVNIFHIHNTAIDFKTFEYSIIPYYIKSSANSIRCVRIDSVQQ